MNPFVVLYAVIVMAFFALIQGLLALGTGDQGADGKAPDTPLRQKTLSDGLSQRFARSPLLSPLRAFERLVATSGIPSSPQTALSCMAVLTVAGLVMAWFRGLPPIVIVAASLSAGWMLPLIVLVRLRQRRLAAFTGQLPDALGMLVRSLRAGHPVPMGIKMIAMEMPDPIRSEFALVHRSMSFGLNLKQALEKMSRRLGTPEVHYTAACIRIHSATGGNLAEVLDSLASVMRQREILRLKVKALSAQSRLSGNILSAIPFVVFAAIYNINPDYYAKAYTNPKIAMIMAGAGVIVLIGIIAIRRIVNIRA